MGRTSSAVIGGRSDRYAAVAVVRLAQHVAAAPDGLDVVAALRGIGELLAQLADEDVDDLQLRLVHSPVKVVEEHFLREGRAFAQGEEFQHLVLLAGQVNAGTAYFD